MSNFINALKITGVFIGILFLYVFLVLETEEKPHRVIIEGKTYIRSKEYAGNGMYQVILIPVDLTKTK